MPSSSIGRDSMRALSQEEAVPVVPVTNTTSRRSRLGRRLGVRFVNRTKVYLVPSISDYSDKEFTATWMVDEDTAAAQAGLIGDIKAMRTAGAGEGHCSRGLEHMRSAAHMEQRKINKELVMNAVLDAQDAQFEANVVNEEELLEASSRNSRWARENAESMAASDAAYVRRHVRPEVDAFMRPSVDGSGSAVSQEEGDHLSMLQSALQVSDSEDSVESAGDRKQRSTTPPRKGRRLLSTSLQRSAHSSPNSTTLTHPSVKIPGSAVDTLLNQMSSRVGAEAKADATAAGTPMDLPAQTAPTCGDIASLSLQQGSS